MTCPHRCMAALDDIRALLAHARTDCVDLVERISTICDRALAAGAQSAETNEDLAQSEGRQSGGCKPQRPGGMTTLSSHKYSMKEEPNG